MLQQNKISLIKGNQKAFNALNPVFTSTKQHKAKNGYTFFCDAIELIKWTKEKNTNVSNSTYI